MKRSIQLTKSILTTLQLLVMPFAISIGISTSSYAQTGSLTITRTPGTMVAGQGFTVTWSSSEPTAVATKFNCVSPTGGFAGSATLAVSGSSNGTADPNWTWKDSTCEWTVVNAAGTVLASRTDIMKTVPAQVNGVTYIHTDGLGSPVAKSDAAGNLVANSRTRYEPYGMEVAGTATPTIGFTGHVNDADTGLTYMQQRYYDPVAGRFLSTDPVLTDANTAGSFNRYVYANNSPYKYIDPDGRDSAMFYGTNPAYQYRPTVTTETARMALDVGTDLIPFVGTGKSIAEAISNPSLTTIGAVGLSAIPFAKVAGRLFKAETKATRVFTSSDPLVGELATKIEAMYPGHVVGVNVPIKDAAGKLVTDADILLKNGIIQVKSGGGKGLTSQLARTEKATGLPTLGYGPDLKPSIVRSCAATTCEKTLIEAIKP